MGLTLCARGISMRPFDIKLRVTLPKYCKVKLLLFVYLSFSNNIPHTNKFIWYVNIVVYTVIIGK